MASLNIVHVTATFPPYYAGTGNVSYHQARCLAGRGHRVTVVTAAYSGEPDDPPGVEVRRLRPLLRLGNAPLMPALAALPRCDVIHLHLPFIFGAELTLLRALPRRTPLVSTFHNRLLAPGLRGALFRFYTPTGLRMAVARSDRVAVLSLDHVRSYPELRSLLERRPEAVVAVPNGVDPERFSPGDPAPARAALGIPTDAVVALFCAKLDPAHHFKRLDLLLRAVAVAERPGLHVAVLGDGPLEDEYRALAAELGIRERVTFAGARSHAAAADVYRAADFLVLPSAGSESFGIVLIEAFATGIPAIATALPGVRGVVSEGIDGFLVEPGDLESLIGALRRMVDLGPAVRAEMGVAGREKVLGQYTWEHSTDLIEGAYVDAIEARRGRWRRRR